MRTLGAVVIGIIVLSAWQSNTPEYRPPVVQKGSVIVREVFSITSPSGGLFVRRPYRAVPDTESSVFRVEANGTELRRVPVKYGRFASPLIQVVSGLSAGDRIVISDMSAWDQFERVRTQ
jgi:hypothetical protein